MYGIEEGKPANLVMLDAGSVLEAVRLTPARLYVIRTGRVIAQTDEPRTDIVVNGKPHEVRYRIA